MWHLNNFKKQLFASCAAIGAAAIMMPLAAIDAHAQSGTLVTSGMGGGASSTARVQAQVTDLQNRLSALETCGNQSMLFGPSYGGPVDANDCTQGLLVSGNVLYAPNQLRVGSLAAPGVTLDVSGVVRATGDIQSLSRFTTTGTSGTKYLIGNDASLDDIGVANFTQLSGQQSTAVAGMRFGSNAGSYVYGSGGNIGIGTTTLTDKLTVNGGGDFNGFVEGTRLGAGVNPSHPLHVSGNGFITGNLGVGAAPTGNRLHVNGTGRFTSVESSFFWYVSDRNLKDNIEPIQGGLETVGQLRPVTFTMKDSGEPSPGFIAQEVETIIPEIVHTDSQGSKSVDYAKMVAHLVAAVQEQQAEIERLKAEVEALK